MRTFVISLERAHERRARMQAILDRAGIPFEFFPAVDGRAHPDAFAGFYEPRGARMRLGRELGSGELGCFASHRLLWQHAVDSNQPLFVMEDDIDMAEDACAVVGSAVDHLTRFKLIRLSGRGLRGRVEQPLSDRHALVRFPRRLVATGSYMIAPSGADALLKGSGKWREPVDEYIDRFWIHGIDIIGLNPFPIWQRPENKADSSVQIDRKKVRGPAKIWREVVRVGDELGRNTANIAALPRLARKPRYRPR